MVTAKLNFNLAIIFADDTNLIVKRNFCNIVTISNNYI